MALIARTGTKKELRTKVGQPAADWMTETTMFEPEMAPGRTVVCTNHPRRSWFAQVQIGPNGEIAKVT